MAAKTARRKQPPAKQPRKVTPRDRVVARQISRGRPEWKWRTFPVFFALVSGLLIASFLNGTPDNTIAAIVQIAALAGFFYGLVHLFVVNVIVAGRAKKRAEAEARGISLDDDFEEETIYPDEAPVR